MVHRSNDADRNTEDSDTEDRFDLQSVLKDLPKVVWATFRVTNGVPAYLQGDEPIIFGNGQAPCDVVLRYPRICESACSHARASSIAYIGPLSR